MDIGSIFKTVAPWIGTALTGGAGPLVGMAVSAAASALGASDKTADGIKAAITGATPEQMLALKQADQGFALQMQELGFKDVESLEAIAAGDRDSARKMQMANHSVVPAILTLVLTVGFFAVLLAKMTHALPNGDDPIVNQMIGTLLAVWTASIAYWVGTTRNSFDKTQMLAQSTPAP